jgi:HAD superfamily hydrolase (TIGR01509 family)
MQEAANVNEVTDDSPGEGDAPLRKTSTAAIEPLVRVLLAVGVVGVALLATTRRRRPKVRRAKPSAKRLLDINVVSAVLLDVDGTLIDSNAAHAETWAAALTEHGVRRHPHQVRPLIGMGADKLLPRIAGISADSKRGQSIAALKKSLFAERLPRLQPTSSARALVSYLRELEKDVVVATSADEREMVPLLKQADVADLIPERTSKDDAEQSKPDPEIVCAALARAGSPRDTTVMIGDTPYDIEAAHRAGIAAIALRCGGHWTDAQLGRAAAIFDNPAHLLAYWRQGRDARLVSGT